MTAVVQNRETVKTIEVAQAAAPAIESKPLAGGEVNIKLALTPGTMLLLAVPASVLLTMLVGWVILVSTGTPVYAREMTAGAIVNTVGGLLAVLPLFFFMKRGVKAILQCWVLAISIRVGAILMGLVLAMGPGWALVRMPLVYWVLAFYFPLLFAETAMGAWLSQKARY